MNITPAGVAIAGAVGAVAVGAGIGGASLAAPWRRDAKEAYQDERYAELDAMAAESAKQGDGRVLYPFPTLPYRDEGEGYAQVISVMVPGAAALAAGGFGAAAMLKGGSPMMKLLGAAGVVGGAALLGAVVGGIRGSGQGTAASDARHGLDVDDQAAEVMRNFDRNGDGKISISPADSGGIPEYERRNAHADGRVSYLSIEQDARAADTDGNGHVTADEVRARLETLDTDGSGVITHAEAETRHEIETYGVDDPFLSVIG